MRGRKFWVIALILFFVIFAILQLTNISFVGQGVILGILALAVAVFAAFDL